MFRSKEGLTAIKIWQKDIPKNASVSKIHEVIRGKLSKYGSIEQAKAAGVYLLIRTKTYIAMLISPDIKVLGDYEEGAQILEGEMCSIWDIPIVVEGLESHAMTRQREDESCFDIEASSLGSEFGDIVSLEEEDDITTEEYQRGFRDGQKSIMKPNKYWAN